MPPQDEQEIIENDQTVKIGIESEKINHKHLPNANSSNSVSNIPNIDKIYD